MTWLVWPIHFWQCSLLWLCLAWYYEVLSVQPQFSKRRALGFYQANRKAEYEDRLFGINIKIVLWTVNLLVCIMPSYQHKYAHTHIMSIWHAQYLEQYKRQQLQYTKCHIYFNLKLLSTLIAALFYWKCVFMLHLYSVIIPDTLQYSVIVSSLYYQKCLTRTYFIHILPQLISSKAAVFFISDENSGWLPISLLLIISFSFDPDYDCSVRHTHLFISFAWWDGLFGDCTDWWTLKMASEESWSLVKAHTWLLHFLCMSASLLTSPDPCCVNPSLFEYHVYLSFFSIFGCLRLRKT